MLYPHDNARPSTVVCTTEAVTKFGWTALLDLHYSSDLVAVEFHLFIPLKDRMQGCCYGDVKVPWNALCQGLQEEGEQVLLCGSTCCCSKVEED